MDMLNMRLYKFAEIIVDKQFYNDIMNFHYM